MDIVSCNEAIGIQVIYYLEINTSKLNEKFEIIQIETTELFLIHHPVSLHARGSFAIDNNTYLKVKSVVLFN